MTDEGFGKKLESNTFPTRRRRRRRREKSVSVETEWSFLTGRESQAKSLT